ncbi:AraC family transcriptional regulator [Neorhizobium sp. NCHU2750]|uniref:helix-turn-helix domain-containing protein n=1 Tax=Neorhizobium sp. NCHU2750 TaxID=1825976 RepID=UPI0013C53777
MQVCTAEMLSLRQSTRTGTLTRSATLICSLAGSRLIYALDNGRSFFLDPGMIAAVSAADTMTLLTETQRGEQNRLLVIQASAEAIMDADLADEIDRRTQSTQLALTPATERTSALANQLLRGSLNRLSDKLVAESCALEVLAQWLNQRHGQLPARGDRAKIQQICDYLEASLEKEHHLTELARKAGMSLSSFKTKFHALTGQTVFGFLAEKRLQRARHGIEREGWSVAEAAWLTGYQHPTNFSSAFRRRFGVNPKSLKQN